MSIIHKTPQFTIYFGDAGDAIDKVMHCDSSSASLLLRQPFTAIAQKVSLNELALLKQVHGTEGAVVTPVIVPHFTIEGDYLITQEKNIGLGVLTADCLPLVFYDTRNHSVGIAHAGWKGTVANIAAHTLGTMSKEFGTHPGDLEVFLGPCAKVCCYQVNDEFVSPLEKYPFYTKTIRVSANQFYFDLAEFNCLQLQDIGISFSAINRVYNHCTICNVKFFSHRRENRNTGRQITIVALN